MVTVEEFLAWWNGDDDAGFTFVWQSQ
jgi:hypothetical protein